MWRHRRKTFKIEYKSTGTSDSLRLSSWIPNATPSISFLGLLDPGSLYIFRFIGLWIPVTWLELFLDHKDRFLDARRSGPPLLCWSSCTGEPPSVPSSSGHLTSCNHNNVQLSSMRDWELCCWSISCCYTGGTSFCHHLRIKTTS